MECDRLPCSVTHFFRETEAQTPMTRIEATGETGDGVGSQAEHCQHVTSPPQVTACCW